MSNDYLPTREADLVTWTQNFSTKIAPLFASIGITTGQASSYGTLSSAFVTAFLVANDPAPSGKKGRRPFILGAFG